MIVRVDIKTGRQTIIEPINEKDKEGLGEVLKALYYQHQKECKIPKQVNA